MAACIMLYIIAVAIVAFFFFLGPGSVLTAVLPLNSSRMKDIGEKFQNMFVKFALLMYSRNFCCEEILHRLAISFE